MIARAWGVLLLALGSLLFVAMSAAWAIAALVLWVVLPAHAGRRVGRRGAMWGFRAFLAIMESLGAWRLDLGALDELRGAGPLVVAPNHPGLLDAVLVVSRLPDAVCVMKRSLLGNFLLGPAARLAGYVRNDTLLRLVAQSHAQLEAGGQLLLFPEGTRSRANPIGPFTEAVGAVARRAGVPVQAVIIEDETRFLGKGWPLLRVPPFPLAYRVRLGRRFDPPADVREFTADLERHFQRELARVTEPADAAPAEDVMGSAPHLRG